MRKHYSRLASVEENRNRRQAVIYVVLTVLAIGLVFFFGIPGLARFAGFLTEIRTSETPIDKNDTTPPAPPRLDSLPENTNKTAISVTGTTEAGATVFLSLNNETVEVLADKDGKFVTTFELNKGENTVSGKVKDQAGNESQETQLFRVLFDNEAPKIEVTSPSDGADFFGAKQSQLVIQGTSDTDSSLTINERVTPLDEAGSFTFAANLLEGENTFFLKATDKAGNFTESSLTVRFTP